jgi:hypothetical protein
MGHLVVFSAYLIREKLLQEIFASSLMPLIKSSRDIGLEFNGILLENR